MPEKRFNGRSYNPTRCSLGETIRQAMTERADLGAVMRSRTTTDTMDTVFNSGATVTDPGLHDSVYNDENNHSRTYPDQFQVDPSS